MPGPVSHRRPGGRLLSRLIWLTVLALVLAGIAWIVWHPRAAPPHQGRPGFGGSMPVVAATAAKGDIEIELKALGTVTAPATVTIKPQIGGPLTEIAFTEGQTVHTGDFLAQIDPRPYQLALAQAEGQLRRDQALLTAESRELPEALAFLQQARASAEDVLQREGTHELVSLYDPVPFRIVRVAHVCRAQLLVEATQRSALHTLLRRWLADLNALPEARRVRWQLEVDPLEI